MAGDMGPPPARTSFKRSAEDEDNDSQSKRAKPSSSRTEAQASKSERPKRYTPDGREIPYITPRPNGSWRMITGEDIVYSPEERPTRAPPPKPKPSSQPTINQSFGQSTSSGKPRKSVRERIVMPPTSSSSQNPTSSMRSNPSSQNSSIASSSRPNQGASRSQPLPSSSRTQAQQRTQQASSSASTMPTIKLVESIGDIFTAPPNTLIIHACNTEGSWGAGIAKAFNDKYPSAFEVYKEHCHLNGGELVGKALLIPPQGDDENQHFVGCLFTSLSKGRKVDSPTKILNATGPAMRDLIRQVKEWNASHVGSEVGEVRMCKINSGLFNVKWEKTKEVIQSIPAEINGIAEIKVVSRSEED